MFIKARTSIVLLLLMLTGLLLNTVSATGTGGHVLLLTIEEAIGPATTGGFSFVELFLQAHFVVQIVMLGLLIASVWSWAIVVEKLVAFRRARRESDDFENMFWSGQSLDELYGALSRSKTITTGALFVSAMREWKRSVEGNIRALGGIQLRVDKVMDALGNAWNWATTW